jgi:hypothetical protein
MPPPGECRATDLRPTIRHTRSGTDRVHAHAIRHANDGPGSIYDLQAHGPTTVPLPGSPRCARSGLAPQRTGCVEPDTPSNIALMRTSSALKSIGFTAIQGTAQRWPTAEVETEPPRGGSNGVTCLLRRHFFGRSGCCCLSDRRQGSYRFLQQRNIGSRRCDVCQRTEGRSPSRSTSSKGANTVGAVACCHLVLHKHDPPPGRSAGPSGNN